MEVTSVVDGAIIGSLEDDGFIDQLVLLAKKNNAFIGHLV
jgi:hypothetical protein